jgi:hypothetical protein
MKRLQAQMSALESRVAASETLGVQGLHGRGHSSSAAAAGNGLTPHAAGQQFAEGDGTKES